MKKYTLTESRLRGIIREAVKSVLNEYQGGSSASGYSYNWSTGGVDRNQGGAFGGSGLDQWHDDNKYQQNQQAAQYQGTGRYYQLAMSKRDYWNADAERYAKQGDWEMVCAMLRRAGYLPDSY